MYNRMDVVRGVAPPPGGWDETPIGDNLKCIVFSLTTALAYWNLPSKNKYVLASLLYLCYAALAYYDMAYACERHKLGPSPLAVFYDWMKPQSSQQIITYKNWDPRIKNKVRLIDAGVVVALLVGASTFIKWQPKGGQEEEAARRKDNAKAAVFLGGSLGVMLYLRFFTAIGR